MALFKAAWEEKMFPAKWSALMKENTKKEIRASVERTKIYNEASTVIYAGETTVPSTAVEDIDSVGAVFKYAGMGGKTALLNFASFTSPGGGFLRGAKAQEECLCRASNLYNILSQFPTYYAENNADLNGHLYYDRGMYSPDVVFFDWEEKPKIVPIVTPVVSSTLHIPRRRQAVDVITVAAPFKARLSAKCTDEQYRAALESRIKLTLDIAQDNAVETLILGAFGCGVFKNDPNEVASLYKKHLESGKYSFRQVIFAIPDRNCDNFKAFQKAGL